MFFPSNQRNETLAALMQLKYRRQQVPEPVKQRSIHTHAHPHTHTSNIHEVLEDGTFHITNPSISQCFR